MRRLAKALIACSFLLLLLAGPSQAAVMAGQKNESYSGKLITITALSNRYKLIIDKRVMYIPINDDQHTRLMIKTAQSLINKKVTVTYRDTSNLILSINPFKKKTFY